MHAKILVATIVLAAASSAQTEYHIYAGNTHAHTAFTWSHGEPQPRDLLRFLAKAQIRRFQEGLAELAGQKRPANITPRLWAAQRDAAQSQLQDLIELVEAYENLHLGKRKELRLEAVEDLPKTLIRARIASGMTQEGLARRLGVKPQQIQRYEATEYESASFARIRKVVQALGLRLPRPARLVCNA